MKSLLIGCLFATALLFTPVKASAQRACPAGESKAICETADSLDQLLDDIIDAQDYVFDRGADGVYYIFFYPPDLAGYFRDGTEEMYDPYIDYVWGAEEDRPD